MFKTREELRAAGAKVLEMCEQHERGEISTKELLDAWKEFTQNGYAFIEALQSEINRNLDWN